MNPRFFCPDGLLPDSDMPLPLSVAHHAERVLRLAVGDPVVLIGRQGGATLSAETWARRLGTIGYEVLTGLGHRYERNYVGAFDLSRAEPAGELLP